MVRRKVMGYLFRLLRYRTSLLGNVGRWFCVTLLSKASCLYREISLDWSISFVSFEKCSLYEVLWHASELWYIRRELVQGMYQIR